jgi:hypothetical protein
MPWLLRTPAFVLLLVASTLVASDGVGAAQPGYPGSPPTAPPAPPAAPPAAPTPAAPARPPAVPALNAPPLGAPTVLTSSGDIYGEPVAIP